jgi:hypothetical protein
MDANGEMPVRMGEVIAREQAGFTTISQYKIKEDL